MSQYVLTLESAPERGGKTFLDATSAGLSEFMRLARGAVALAFRRSSVWHGKIASWFERATELAIDDISKDRRGSLRCVLSAPQFGEAAEEVYRQQEFFQLRPPPDTTALDLVRLSVADVARLEPSLRNQIAGRLRSHGYVVDLVGDGEEGLFIGSEYPLDVAIVDLGLPKLSGLEVIRRGERPAASFPCWC